MSLSRTSTQWSNKKIIYDKVLFNVGRGYSAQTGVFTCPSDGEYVFTWNTMSNTGVQDCFAFIYRNGVRLLESYSIDDSEMASNTEVFQLIKGDFDLDSDRPL